MVTYLHVTTLHPADGLDHLALESVVTVIVFLPRILVYLLVWRYLLKLSLLFLFPSPNMATTSIVFSHLICPRVIPTQKCENDLVWTATYTAGKFHHGWMGDFCTWFLLECSINNVTNKCPFSTFSSFSFQKYCHWQEATGKHSLGVCY